MIMLRLMSMTKDLIPPSPCSNCQKKPCRSGEVITGVEQVMAGTIVAPNPLSTPYANWNMDHRGTTVVKSTMGEKVIVDKGTGATKYILATGYTVHYDNIPNFLFFCKN